VVVAFIQVVFFLFYELNEFRNTRNVPFIYKVLKLIIIT